MSAQTATIVVTDLVGSTEMRVRLGEDAADALRRVHDDLLTAAVTDHDGTVVKGLGDGVLALFASSADAISAAVQIQQDAHRHGRRQPDQELAIRVGVSVGDVSIEGGDCFGTPVIEAARLCAAAQGGQVLAAALVEALARGRGGHEYREFGELNLKGLPDPIRTVEVRWAPAVSGSGAVPPFPPLLHDERGVSFVGRPAALELLGTLWKQADAGQRRCVLLAGEPGVGKTRLAAEAARRAHDEGTVVLLGRCDEELGLPFQPFVEALAYFVATAAPSVDDLGRHPADLARLYPELRDLVPGLGEPLRGDPDIERHRLFEAVVSWLEVTAESAGVVLVLDDLHWAGKPTLLLLRHLLRSAVTARLLVIGTYRDTDLDRTHPLGELLADLRREPGVERLPLAGFTAEEVGEFVVAASGEELDEAKRSLAVAVHAETEGNAFFVGEVLRHLAESGAIVQRDGRWHAAVALEDMAIPEGVREVIGRRVSRLPDVVNDVLRWASVIGRDVEFDILADVVDATDDVVLGALDEAIDARLVEETGAGSYRFVHALVRTTLLDEVRTTRRVRMHLRIGEAIEDRRPRDLAALAHHFVEAASAGVEAKAMDYTARAAQQAMDRTAFDAAASLYAAALELLDDAELDDPIRRIDLLLGLGEASFAMGGGGHVRPLERAVELARTLGDAERMAAGLLAAHRGWGSIAFTVNEALVADIEAALDLLPDGDSVVRARLVSLLAVEVSPQRGDGGRCVALHQEALAMSRRLADDRAIAASLAGRWVSKREPFGQAETEAQAGELDRIAARLGDRRMAGWALSMRYQAALEFADGPAIARLSTEGRAVIEELGTVVQRWTQTVADAGLCLYRGALDVAEPLIEEALAIGQEAGQPDAFQWYGNQMLFLRRQQGRGDEMVPLLVDMIAARPLGYEYWQGALALLLAESDRLVEARPAFAEGYAIFPGHQFDTTYVPHGATLAHTAVDLGERDVAPVLLESLLPYRGQMAHWSPLAPVSPVDLATGRLLLLLGRLDEAATHLDGSVELCERGGYLPFLAETRLAQGVLAVTLGDGSVARTRVAEALDLSVAGGFGTTERRARAALAGLA